MMSLAPSSLIRALIQPLVLWCLRHGVRSAQVEELVREAFVRAAESEILNAQGGFSVSKVSVMTGLHRSEVSRLLSGERSDRGQHDILNRVIGLWSTSKSYRHPNQTVKQLTYEGLGSEFAALVAKVSKEVTHYPILFELERIGAIEYQDNLVRLVTREYTPQEDVDYGLALLGADTADLTAAIEANIVKKHSEQSLHLRTSFDNIDPQSLPEIRLWILRKGAEFQAMVRDYLSKFDRDTSGEAAEGEGTEGRARVTVTAFSYAEPLETARVIMPKKRGRKKCNR
jgi:predicted transcriptional regulator